MPDTATIPNTEEAERTFWMARRQAILIELAAIEKRYNMPRSVPTKQEREQARHGIQR